MGSTVETKREPVLTGGDQRSTLVLVWPEVFSGYTTKNPGIGDNYFPGFWELWVLYRPPIYTVVCSSKSSHPFVFVPRHRLGVVLQGRGGRPCRTRRSNSSTRSRRSWASSTWKSTPTTGTVHTLLLHGKRQILSLFVLPAGLRSFIYVCLSIMLLLNVCWSIIWLLFVRIISS